MTLVVDGVCLKYFEGADLDRSVVNWELKSEVEDFVRCAKALDRVPKEFEWRPAPVPEGFEILYSIGGRTVLLSGILRTNRPDSLSEE